MATLVSSVQLVATFDGLGLCTNTTINSAQAVTGTTSFLGYSMVGNSTLTTPGDPTILQFFYSVHYSDGSYYYETCTPVYGQVVRDPTTGQWLLEETQSTISLPVTTSVSAGVNHTLVGLYTNSATTTLSAFLPTSAVITTVPTTGATTARSSSQVSTAVTTSASKTSASSSAAPAASTSAKSGGMRRAGKFAWAGVALGLASFIVGQL